MTADSGVIDTRTVLDTNPGGRARENYLEALSSGARIAAQQHGRIGTANQSNSGVRLGLECSEVNARCFLYWVDVNPGETAFLRREDTDVYMARQTVLPRVW